MAPDLLVICLSAFIAVFVLLSALAAVMRLLIMVYPERMAAEPDAAVIAAVASVASAAFPGTKVTRIEERR